MLLTNPGLYTNFL